MNLLLAPVEKISSPSLKASFENSMEIARRLASRLEYDAAAAARRFKSAYSSSDKQISAEERFRWAAAEAGADFCCLYVRREGGWHLIKSLPEKFDRADSVMVGNLGQNRSPLRIDLSDPDLIASALPLAEDTTAVVGLALEHGLTSRMRKTGEDLSLYGSAGEWVTSMRLYITLILSMIVAAAAVSATLLSRALARRISFPIKRLAAATKHLAAGDLDYRVNLTARDEVGLLVESFNNMAQQLKANRERIIEMTRRQAQIERDFEIARQVQTNLFPKTLPSNPTWEFAALCVPARAVGGDYYDVFQVTHNHILIAQGDVSGKGLGASMVMASIHAMVRSLSEKLGSNPATIVDEINRYLAEVSSPETFVTLFVGFIDCDQGLLQYVNCGHPPAILQRASGQFEELSSGGTVLGILPHYDCSEGTCKINAGDSLVIVSDGVTEALNLEDQMFEQQKLVETLIKHRNASAQTILDAILDEVRAFTRGREQGDDISVLSIRRKLRHVHDVNAKHFNG